MWWWKRRIHISWLIALACAGFVAGVAVAPYCRIFFWLGVVGCVCSIILCVFSRFWCLPLLAVASAVSGLGFGAAHLIARSIYEPLVGRVSTVKGMVKEDPSFKAGSVSLQLVSVTVDGSAMPGVIYASARGVKDVKRSDSIQGIASIKDGFGNFAISAAFKAVQAIERPKGGDPGREVRDWFADSVRRVIPEPAASLGVGFLTGQKSALPSELSDSLKIAGLTHIVVASGYNLTILVQLARRLFARVSKYIAALAAAAMIISFMGVTGLSPSMTRAGLVSGFSLLGWYYGRAFHPFVLLPLAAAITVAFEPSYAWGDIGWQLSFGAFAAVMVVAPLLHHYFFGERKPGLLRQIAGETVAAHLVTMPIIALSFGVISNLAIVANMLVVPLVPLAMLLTFVCGVLALVSIPMATLLAVPTAWLLNYMTTVASMIAEIPWAQVSIKDSTWVWGLYVAMLAIGCVWMWRKAGRFAWVHNLHGSV